MLKLFISGGLLVFLLVGCQGQSKEDLLKESETYLEQGNHRGAMVLLRNALDKDPNFTEARMSLARIYFDIGQVDNSLNELSKVEAQSGATPDLLILRAEGYLAKGQPQNSIDILKRLSEEEQNTSRAFGLHGRALAAQRKWASSAEFLRKAVAGDGADKLSRINLCQVLEAQGMPGEAQACLKEYIAKWPKRREGVLLLAQLKIRDGKVEAATSLLEDYTSGEVLDPDALYQLGLLYLNQKRVDKAAAIAQRLTTQAAGNSRGHVLTGQVALAKKDFPAALASLNKAAGIQRDTLTEYFLGVALFGQENYGQALNSFQRVLDLQPGFVQARTMVAATLLRQDRYEDAAQAVATVLAQEPDNIAALRVASGAAIAMGNFDEANGYLQKAIETSPHRGDLYIAKGAFEASVGEVGESLETLRQALAQDPKNIRVRVTLASDAARRQNYQTAMKLLKEGLVGDRSDGVLRNMMGFLLNSQGKEGLAVEAFETAKKDAPNFKAPYFNLARISLRQADYESALREFDAVLTFAPEDTTALLNKARLLDIMKRQDDALQVLLQARDNGTMQGFLALSQYYFELKKMPEALATIEEGLVTFPDNLLMMEMKARLQRLSQSLEGALATYASMEKVQQGAGYPNSVAMLLANNQEERARQIVDEQKERQPSSPYSYLLESVFFEQQNKLPAALKALEKGQKVSDSTLPLFRRMVILNDRLGNRGQSLKVASQWVKQHKNDFQAHFILGVYQEQAGDIQMAQESYRNCLRLNRNYVPALNNLAYLFTDRIGKPKEALPLARKAVELAPGNPAVLDTLGYVYFSLADYPKALEFFQKATNINPQMGDVHYHTAKTLVKLGKKVQAKAAVQKALDSKDLTQRGEAEALLKSL